MRYRRIFGVLIWCVLAAAMGIGCGPVDGSGPGPASGAVTSSEGQVRVIPRPATVVPNENQGEDIRVFLERNDYTLPEDLPVEATEPGDYSDASSLSDQTVAADKSVDVLYLHADTEDSGSNNKQATLTFDRPIAGVISSEEAMVEANEVLQVSSLPTKYPNAEDNPQFGISQSEGDRFEIGPQGRTLTIELVVWAKSDSFRVVFEE